MKSPPRWLLPALGVVILAGLFAASLLSNPQWKTFDWEAFRRSLTSVDWAWTAAALAAIYTTYLVRALRWQVLMRPLKPAPGLWNILSATVIGFAALGIFGRAGELVRPYLVARKEGVSIASQLGVWLIERAFDMLTLLVTVAFAFGQIDQASLRSGPGLARLLHVGGNLVAVSMLAMVTLLVVLRHFADPLAKWMIARLHFLSPPRLDRLRPSIASFVNTSRGLRDLRVLIPCILYSIAEWVLVAACCFAVFNSVSGGTRLSLTQTLIFMGSIMAGSMVQIPGVGGGIQVASLLVLTELFGFRPEPAAGISLLIWALTFLAVVPPAIPLILYEGLSWGKLKRLPGTIGAMTP